MPLNMLQGVECSSAKGLQKHYEAMAVVLARSLNMVGTEEEITGEQAAEWADCFYNLLRQGQALHKAFDLAASQVDAPLLLVPHRDVVFTVLEA